MNFMAAVGPDFKAGFTDLAPSSNADVGRTMAQLLGLNLRSQGKLVGRVLTEALTGGKAIKPSAGVLRSAPAPGGWLTVLQYQDADGVRYFDAAGFPLRTVGLAR